MRVAERYQIGEDRYIEAQGSPERSRSYDPWEFPELSSEFAQIQPGDDASLRKFVDRWGLPGELLDRSIPSRGGDSTEMIEKHAAIARFALQLIALIRLQDSGRMDAYLASEWPEVERFVSGALLGDQEADVQAALGKTGLRAGGEVLRALIYYRIEGKVGPDYQVMDDGMPRRVSKADQLLQVIYCHLGDAWEGKTGYYQCENRNCFRWWPIDREHRGPKPKYCPPERGSGESLCGRQERYYRSSKR